MLIHLLDHIIFELNEISLNLMSLAEPRCIDNIAIIAPIVLSGVAIFISISTARRQNQIALFDKRYDILKKINRLRTFKLIHKFYDENKNNTNLSQLFGYTQANLISSHIIFLSFIINTIKQI